MKVLKLIPNKTGRDFVTGDIHGAFNALAEALLRVGFDRKVDRLFVTGDLVDRGGQSAEVLDWLREPWFYSVRGNHEGMAIEHHIARENSAKYKPHLATKPDTDYMYSANGGDWFINLPLYRQAAYVEEFEKLPYAIQIGDEVGIVHAMVPFGKTWDEFVALFDGPSANQVIETATWGYHRYNFGYDNGATEHVDGIKWTVHGHSITQSGGPELYGNSWFIDLGQTFSGRVELFDLADLEEMALHQVQVQQNKRYSGLQGYEVTQGSPADFDDFAVA